MKLNPERQWSIQFWGDGENYLHTTFRGTIEGVLAHADEAECEFDWEVLRMSIFVAGY